MEPTKQEMTTRQNAGAQLSSETWMPRTLRHAAIIQLKKVENPTEMEIVQAEARLEYLADLSPKMDCINLTFAEDILHSTPASLVHIDLGIGGWFNKNCTERLGITWGQGDLARSGDDKGLAVFYGEDISLRKRARRVEHARSMSSTCFCKLIEETSGFKSTRGRAETMGLHTYVQALPVKARMSLVERGSDGFGRTRLLLTFSEKILRPITSVVCYTQPARGLESNVGPVVSLTSILDQTRAPKRSSNFFGWLKAQSRNLNI